MERKKKYLDKTCPSTVLSNTTQPDLSSNTGHSCGNLVTNPSYVTGILNILVCSLHLCFPIEKPRHAQFSGYTSPSNQVTYDDTQCIVRCTDHGKETRRMLRHAPNFRYLPQSSWWYCCAITRCLILVDVVHTQMCFDDLSGVNAVWPRTSL